MNKPIFNFDQKVYAISRGEIISFTISEIEKSGNDFIYRDGNNSDWEENLHLSFDEAKQILIDWENEKHENKIKEINELNEKIEE